LVSAGENNRSYNMPWLKKLGVKDWEEKEDRIFINCDKTHFLLFFFFFLFLCVVFCLFVLLGFYIAKTTGYLQILFFVTLNLILRGKDTASKFSWAYLRFVLTCSFSDSFAVFIFLQGVTKMTNLWVCSMKQLETEAESLELPSI
jgi:hypothetical protein